MLQAPSGHLLLTAAMLLLAVASPLHAQQVFLIELYAGLPRISSDGKVVAYGSGGGLNTSRPDGSGKVSWNVPFATQMSLSGDGRLIVHDYISELRILDTVTGQLSILLPASSHTSLANVSDDGSTIVFWDWGGGLHVIDSDGTDYRYLGQRGQADGPSITADGSVVAFVDQAPDDYLLGVHRMNSDGTGLAALTEPDGRSHLRARISGDGSVITYETYNRGFHAVDGDGSNPRDLVSGVHGGPVREGLDYSDVSLDGRVGVFVASEGLFVAATDGSWVRQIHTEGEAVDISGTGDVVISMWEEPSTGFNAVWTIGVPFIRPGEMMDMALSSDAQTLTWATRPSAYSHHLYRARWSSPGTLTPAAVGECLQGGIVGTTTADADLPAPGEVFGYFVTGANAWGEGPSERTPQGDRRVPALSCPGGDTDGDSFPDAVDVCPLVADPAQDDPDGDGLGSPCDNCPGAANADQFDFDLDGIGNACDL